ncbi:MAG: S-methyl-5'-thioadenosine phosphorylase [Nitrospirae bacterium CG_4_9_14_3_um_filter_53_35]|nr:MAG: methylthioadenosine phosphorylase [Nitrospirae bacterium CG2_30_53_67]PIW85152.1 MAG: S-methyl-5'-thioadenosine phosphorylase [Nitrospirae bacterium CG_4_8_14_3_um_filter_50_41]PIX86754.1 MAG: S-methyl-5'-thioadenosine phosphorylase [Nitrospirae bacterium CG_4_10_14_3_um_filter_53_41]PJA74208.1 MAG: S-methyl-5'-thioadenosine phosphorylase [Nitrospirae bacterium CG_4_9_14_3_um_filter_53_35]
MPEAIEIGVIGGSGLYEIQGIEGLREAAVSTPFGDPSDLFHVGKLNGIGVAFLPRHGRGHRILPSDINFRANIYAMKKLGVRRIISVSAVGSMKEEIAPGDIVIPDQFFDHTKKRVSTFFGDGIAGHVAMADPVCRDLCGILIRAGKRAGAKIHEGGTYLCIEGPQFSTRAESKIFRSWGVDVIGMTNVTEAKLAREAGICYATLALSTDYDCWHTEEEGVSADAVLSILRNNVAKAKEMIRLSLSGEILQTSCRCRDAVKGAILTDPSRFPEETRRRLEFLL